jgi:hypothetical protein
VIELCGPFSQGGSERARWPGQAQLGLAPETMRLTDAGRGRGRRRWIARTTSRRPTRHRSSPRNTGCTSAGPRGTAGWPARPVVVAVLAPAAVAGDPSRLTVYGARPRSHTIRRSESPRAAENSLAFTEVQPSRPALPGLGAGSHRAAQSPWTLSWAVTDRCGNSTEDHPSRYI